MVNAVLPSWKVGRKHSFGWRQYLTWKRQLRLAKSWLLLQEKTPYFAEPASEAEALVNYQSLSKLVSEHDAEVTEMLRDNEELLIEVAKAIRDSGELSKDQILSYASRTK